MPLYTTWTDKVVVKDENNLIKIVSRFEAVSSMLHIIGVLIDNKADIKVDDCVVSTDIEGNLFIGQVCNIFKSYFGEVIYTLWDKDNRFTHYINEQEIKGVVVLTEDAKTLCSATKNEEIAIHKCTCDWNMLYKIGCKCGGV